MHMNCKPVLIFAIIGTHLSLLHSAEKSQFEDILSSPLFKNRLEKRHQRITLFHKSDDDDKLLHAASRSRHGDDRAGRFQSAELALANAHFLQIRSNYSCQRPRPRLVYMKDLFYSLEKTYMPRCTVLHKCDDESGCCIHEGHECAPKRQQAVQLFFFVSLRNMTRSVETVTFANHTECECRPINRPRSQSAELENLIKDVLGSDKAEVVASAVVIPAATASTEKNTQSSTALATVSTSPLPPVVDTSLRLIDDSKLLDSQQDNKGKKSLCSHMKCPAPFEARKVTSYPQRCECDCLSETDTRCMRIKKGLQRLNGYGATCVRRGTCQMPSCEYSGAFDMMRGACPQKNGDDYAPHQHHKKHYGHERD